MEQSRYQSWGRYPRNPQRALCARDRFTPFVDLDDFAELSMLPFGNGRSYGDSCLNDGGLLLDTRKLDKFIHFDPERALLRCESGVLLAAINDLIHPHGLVLPTTPGTAFVTVGGAVANDVHGKNHHLDGSFGCHVKALEIWRSDGSKIECSVDTNRGLFDATIGGLGLTGLITWVEIALKRVPCADVFAQTIPSRCLDESIRLLEDSEQSHEYVAAWIDCLAHGRNLGRGYITRANHLDASFDLEPSPSPSTLQIPFTPPISPLNRLSLRAFNELIYCRKAKPSLPKRCAYSAFHYPLDGIHNWNKLYGRSGFLQYQCVIPGDDAHATVRQLLMRIASSGEGSFLTVLKKFGPTAVKWLAFIPATWTDPGTGLPQSR